MYIVNRRRRRESRGKVGSRIVSLSSTMMMAMMMAVHYLKKTQKRDRKERRESVNDRYKDIEVNVGGWQTKRSC